MTISVFRVLTCRVALHLISLGRSTAVTAISVPPQTATKAHKPFVWRPPSPVPRQFVRAQCPSDAETESTALELKALEEEAMEALSAVIRTVAHPYVFNPHFVAISPPLVKVKAPPGRGSSGQSGSMDDHGRTSSVRREPCTRHGRACAGTVSTLTGHEKLNKTVFMLSFLPDLILELIRPEAIGTPGYGRTEQFLRTHSLAARDECVDYLGAGSTVLLNALHPGLDPERPLLREHRLTLNAVRQVVEFFLETLTLGRSTNDHAESDQSQTGSRPDLTRANTSQPMRQRHTIYPMIGSSISGEPSKLGGSAYRQFVYSALNRTAVPESNMLRSGYSRIWCNYIPITRSRVWSFVDTVQRRIDAGSRGNTQNCAADNPDLYFMIFPGSQRGALARLAYEIGYSMRPHSAAPETYWERVVRTVDPCRVGDRDWYLRYLSDESTLADRSSVAGESSLTDLALSEMPSVEDQTKPVADQTQPVADQNRTLTSVVSAERPYRPLFGYLRRSWNAMMKELARGHDLVRLTVCEYLPHISLTLELSVTELRRN